MNPINKNLISEIKNILIPKLNEFIAESVIRVNCRRIGVEPEELNMDKLPKFLEKIEVSLLLFLTKEEILDIVQKIKKLRV
jgi:hypothetical protein